MKQLGAKIVATLGPASADTATIRAMVDAGLDVVRLNFSHGDHATLAVLVTHVRAVQAESGKALAILGDLQGPRLRLGALPEPLPVRAGQPLRISTEPGHTGPETVSCSYAGLARDLQAGDRVFLRDGEIELEVTATSASVAETRVLVGGTLTSRAGMNVPSTSLGMATLTAQDRKDIQFAVEQRMDYLALSFVRRGRDVEDVRDLVEAAEGEMGIIAKIENAEALLHLTEILEAADGVMVARGDLGVEVGSENVPVWQRRIIAGASEQLVPVIVATQMLESMVENPRPSRAEASDVANAVWDGTDAVMLSAETAVGAYPVETVAMMARIVERAEEAESVRQTPAYASEWWEDPSRSISWATRSIVQQNPQLRAVMAFTVTGYTARLVAKDRMRVPVLVLAPEARVEQRMALLWGVRAVHCPAPGSVEEMLQAVDERARVDLGCDDGDTVVVVAGLPLGQGKPTNFLKVHEIGDDTGSREASQDSERDRRVGQRGGGEDD